jgi:hypothetical protein
MPNTTRRGAKPPTPAMASAEQSGAISTRVLPSTKTATTALTAPQVALLRMIIRDSDFRKQFLDDPVAAAGAAKVKVSPEDLAVIARLKPQQFDAIQNVVSGIAPRADDTETALHALAYAVVVALVLAMPNPMEVGERIAE